MRYRYLLVDDCDGVRTVTLNNPDRRNALNPEMQDELIDTFVRVSSSPIRVLVLRGAGDAFCAGLDLSSLNDRMNADVSSYREDAERIARLFRTMYGLPIPTISIVHGVALAGGMGLAILSDFTVATPAARFGLTEARVGFIPAIVSAFLFLQVGEKKCRDLMVSARVLNASEACRMGFVNEVIDPESLAERITCIMQSLKRNSRTSMSHAKRLLAEYNGEWLEHAMSLGIEASVRSRATPDFREGILSFLEKRPPSWTA